MEDPKVGSEWLHTNGKTYRVLCYVNTKPGLPQDEYKYQVVYYDINDPIELYAKSVEGFVRSRTQVKPTVDWF